GVRLDGDEIAIVGADGRGVGEGRIVVVSRRRAASAERVDELRVGPIADAVRRVLADVGPVERAEWCLQRAAPAQDGPLVLERLFLGVAADAAARANEIFAALRVGRRRELEVRPRALSLPKRRSKHGGAGD